MLQKVLSLNNIQKLDKNAQVFIREGVQKGSSGKGDIIIVPCDPDSACLHGTSPKWDPAGKVCTCEPV